MTSESNPRLRITDDDLDRTVVGRLPVSPPPAEVRPVAARARSARWNGVAISALAAALASNVAALLIAAMAGDWSGAVVSVGAVGGLAAVVLGCAALVRPSRSERRGTLLAVGGVGVGVVAVIGWLALWSAFALPEGVNFELAEFEPDRESLERLPPSLQRAMKANALIEGRSGWKGLGGPTIGSGVILRIDGGRAYVVTNRHVVDPGFAEGTLSRAGQAIAAGPVKIKLIGQTSQSAIVEWVAPDGIDLAVAVVPLTSADAQAAAWVADPEAKIGDEVFAVGNPHGLSWTHTSGAISQYRQQNTLGGPVRVIQTNAAINPGNSGGGLYDKAGRLLGITTWTRDKRVAEGLSFAISFETLLKLNPAVLNLAAGDAR
jgi:S1-C subfamily serine protease